MKSNDKAATRGGITLIVVVTILIGAMLWVVFGRPQLTPSAGTVQATAGPADTLAYPPPLSLTSESVFPTPIVAVRPTLLPEMGIQPSSIQALETTRRELNARSPQHARLAALATDGKLLSGMTVQNNSVDMFGQVAVIDLASGELLDLIDVGDAVYPQVSDPYVVWAERGRLYVYDRNKRIASPLELKGQANHPTVSGTVVVWENIVDGRLTGLMAQDLVTGEMWEVTGVGVDSLPHFPSLSGDWVAYESWSFSSDGAQNTARMLQATNVRSRETVVLGPLPIVEGISPSHFALEAPWVVWSEVGQAPTLHFYNFETRERSEVKPDCALNGQYGYPNDLQLSSQTVIFQNCFQWMGYRMKDQTFFSIALPDKSATQVFGGSAFGGGRLIWAEVNTDSKENWLSTDLLTAPLVDGK